jgi:hypothetical protein
MAGLNQLIDLNLFLISASSTAMQIKTNNKTLVMITYHSK